ncbi:hypothetical protein CsSME_00031332 [Camellia sinensis var. sinensis]
MTDSLTEAGENHWLLGSPGGPCVMEGILDTALPAYYILKYKLCYTDSGAGIRCGYVSRGRVLQN